MIAVKCSNCLGFYQTIQSNSPRGHEGTTRCTISKTTTPATPATTAADGDMIVQNDDLCRSADDCMTETEKQYARSRRNKDGNREWDI